MLLARLTNEGPVPYREVLPPSPLFFFSTCLYLSFVLLIISFSSVLRKTERYIQGSSKRRFIEGIMYNLMGLGIQAMCR